MTNSFNDGAGHTVLMILTSSSFSHVQSFFTVSFSSIHQQLLHNKGLRKYINQIRQKINYYRTNS